MKRIISTALAVLLAVSSTPVPSKADSIQAYAFQTLTPSRSIASMVDASQIGTQKVPDVVVIEDLHFNYSVQKHIAALLDFLASKDVVGPAIAVEGATGQVDNSLLTQISNLKVRQELADFLLQNGELTGTQYFSAMSGQPKILQGVEDPMYFQANREIFRQSYAVRMQAIGQVDGLLSRLETLKSSLYSHNVKRLDLATKRFESGRIAPADYWAILRAAGDSAGVPFPQVLSGDALADYKLHVQEALAKSSDESHLLELLNDLELVKAALAQHLTLPQVRKIAAQAERIGSLIEVFSEGPDDELSRDSRRLKEALNSSIDFYVAALMRNSPLLDNTLKLLPLNAKENKSTILIVGGFHADFVQQELKKRGLSYVLFVPRVDTQTPADDELYNQRFMGHRMSANAVLAWIEAHGGIRGSPRPYNGAGIIPPLSGLPWLPVLIRRVDESGSLYGQSKLLATLRKDFGPLAFPDTSDIILTSDLSNPIFDNDNIIPGGPELRDALQLQQTLGIDFPIKELQITRARQVQFKGGSYEFGDETSQRLIDVVKIPGTPDYRAVIHVDAVEKNAIYQENRYLFWELFKLHETAEFSRHHKHTVLAHAHLDANADPHMAIEDLYKGFKQFIPEINEVFADDALRSVLNFNFYASRYIREQQAAERTDLTDKSQLTPADLAMMSSFAWRTGLKPNIDFKTAAAKDITNIEFHRKRITPKDMQEAIQAELEGGVVDEIFGGGAASRLRQKINELIKEGLITQEKAQILWTVGIRNFLDQPDPIHWGAREMIRLNQSIRGLARKYPEAGISEEQALRNHHVILHVNDATYQLVMQDFIDHRFYGFDPAKIYFTVNREYELLHIDPATKTVVKAGPEVSKLVYGHGPAGEMLVDDRAAFRIIGNSLRDAKPLNRPVLDHVMDALTGAHKTSISPILREWRLNDLKLLNSNVIDVRDVALFRSARKSGRLMLFRMVNNVPVVINPGDAPITQAGGIPIVLDVPPQRPGERGSSRVVFFDDLAFQDPATKEMMTEAKKNAGLGLINEMHSLISIPEYAASFRRAGLPIYWTIQKNPETGQPLRTPEGSLYIKTQIVVNDISGDPQINASVTREETDLEDLKMYADSQFKKGAEIVEAMDADPEAMALAAFYGFPITPANLSPENSPADFVRELSRLQMLNKRKVENSNGQGSSNANPKKPALRANDVHRFAMVAALAALVAFFISPLALAMVSPWVLAAAGQEAAVVSHAVASNRARDLVSNSAIATYDFEEQRVEGAHSIAARAEELAHALTQSNSEVATRLVAPLTLAVAILDTGVAAVVDAIHWMISKFSHTPPVDSEMLGMLKAQNSKIQKILAEPVVPALPEASNFWLSISIGLRAVYKNSNTRRAAADLAARQVISGAA